MRKNWHEPRCVFIREMCYNDCISDRCCHKVTPICPKPCPPPPPDYYHQPKPPEHRKCNCGGCGRGSNISELLLLYMLLSDC